MKIEVEIEIRWWGTEETADIYLGSKIGLGRIFKSDNDRWQFCLFGKLPSINEYDSIEEVIYGMIEEIGALN